MNIYLVGPVDCDYDEWDSFVVVAEDEAGARAQCLSQLEWDKQKASFSSAPVALIGYTNGNNPTPRVVLGSFNAG